MIEVAVCVYEFFNGHAHHEPVKGHPFNKSFETEAEAIAYKASKVGELPEGFHFALFDI